MPGADSAPTVRSLRGWIPILMAVLLLLQACAATRGPGGDDTSPRRSSTLITAEEFDGVANIGDAWEAIERLRSTWLRGRGAGGLPVVFVNGQRYGEIDALRSIPAGDIDSARMVSAGDATTLYGTGYPAGIIDIRTRRR